MKIRLIKHVCKSSDINSIDDLRNAIAEHCFSGSNSSQSQASETESTDKSDLDVQKKPIDHTQPVLKPFEAGWFINREGDEVFVVNSAAPMASVAVNSGYARRCLICTYRAGSSYTVHENGMHEASGEESSVDLVYAIDQTDWSDVPCVKEVVRLRALLRELGSFASDFDTHGGIHKLIDMVKESVVKTVFEVTADSSIAERVEKNLR